MVAWGDVVGFAVNITVVVLLAPLTEGVVRKVVARIQGRIGPPVLQAYRDIIKLFSRTYQTKPEATWDRLYDLAPVLALSCIISSAALVPTIVAKPLTLGDLILVFYMAGMARFILSIASFNVGNPFAVVGAARENILTFCIEPIALTSAALMCIMSSSSSVAGVSVSIPHLLLKWRWAYIPALLSFATAILADTALPPFDLAEAEQEISEALLSEYGGPLLALLKLTISCRRLLLLNLLFSLFIPYGMAGGFAQARILSSLLIYLAKVFTLTIILSLTIACASRMKIHSVASYLLYSFMFLIVACVTYAVAG